LAPSTTTSGSPRRRAIGLSLLILAAGCGNGPLGSCDKQQDLTGAWTLSLTPVDGDAGVSGQVIPRRDTVVADLMQIKSAGLLGIGAAIWGRLTSSDKGFFDTLQIPQLTKNNGSKTGAALSCTVKINIPAVTPVSDDDVDQGPLRLALVGQVSARGMMLGDPARSTVILVEDGEGGVPRHFAWTGAQP
jgi:hypothetical protein